ncbi:alanine--tRNA ligase [Oleiagrimonas soli]|uniref:Alanine--tRNA ligase n=1 Tax=Oleiagrimonas soli TaxID=1543381 RepID=A0A099CUK3_9GAMM|nr:alanine--tRNA ligase [Oleiagrimonas soli]KGI77603.1 alanyl-tRNA synthetase [Oleiagrimonas soli]MBB6182906.1 alanyl-tRNA synthetase [Oleiagrimonas soli]
MKTADIRARFLDFFRDRGHTIVPSAPLVPGNDPTLMFTNSGMVQFKNVFLGSEKPGYVRAADVQRCLRAGGKHNDLDSVGYTARHHTFFEMLGNWSFGDYFKREAIGWAWELLTKGFGLPGERLTVTVYETDDEAYGIWKDEIGVPAERIIRIGDNKGAPYASDNFWQMADTGPCGPSSEIFYDHGSHIPGGPPGSPDEDGDRFIEIWNLVFMQFDRQPDGTLLPLPAPCVDTGMGLERLAAILQGVHSNYEIDLFQRLIAAAAKLTGTEDLENKSLRVIADHIRACSFLIVDGVTPSNEGRGYVLRRIIRRAVRHGYMLGMRKPFFYMLVDVLNSEMGGVYPELAESASVVANVLEKEEQRFFLTVERGMGLLGRALSPEVPVMRLLSERLGLPDYGLMLHTSGGLYLDGVFRTEGGAVAVLLMPSSEQSRQALIKTVSNLQSENEGWGEGYRKFLVVKGPWTDADVSRAQALVNAFDIPTEVIEVTEEDLKPYKFLPAETAFSLYDQDGFPIDLTADVCREIGFSVDLEGFEVLMEAQRERARAASRFESKGQLPAELVSRLDPTQFLGYEALTVTDAKVVAIVRDGQSVTQLADGEEGIVLLDRTPFYAESGGQVGDTGVLRSAEGAFAVRDTQKLAGAYHGHAGRWQGAKPLTVDATLAGEVDGERRQAIVLNHSATHLLHAALRKVLGDHVTQKGSLVAPDRLRFDFSHDQPVSAEQLHAIERMVNAQIRRNDAADIRHMGYQEAIDFGAMALFGEKYGDEVRVLKMGDFSTELCGGTHVSRTGDIGLFKIVSESGVAAGVRRIEALTGAGAETYVGDEEAQLHALATQLGVGVGDAGEKLRQILERSRKLERELEAVKARAASAASADLASTAHDVQGIKLVAARMPGMDGKALRDGLDRLKQELGDCVVLLASASDGKATLVGGVHGAALGKVKAGAMIAHVAGQIGGKGGGRPDMAQGGGVDSPALDAALEALPQWLEAQLG